MNERAQICAADDPAGDDWMLKLADSLAWKDDEPSVKLPTVLTRPPLDQTAVGTLDYTEPEKGAAARIWPRWKIAGSAHAVLMARKLFGTTETEFRRQ